MMKSTGFSRIFLGLFVLTLGSGVWAQNLDEKKSAKDEIVELYYFNIKNQSGCEGLQQQFLSMGPVLPLEYKESGLMSCGFLTGAEARTILRAERLLPPPSLNHMIAEAFNKENKNRDEFLPLSEVIWKRTLQPFIPSQRTEDQPASISIQRFVMHDAVGLEVGAVWGVKVDILLPK